MQISSAVNCSTLKLRPMTGSPSSAAYPLGKFLSSIWVAPFAAHLLRSLPFAEPFCGAYLLPYLEQEELYRQFNLDESWDSPHNRELIERMPEVYQNPNFSSRSQTLYVGIAGEGTAFQNKSSFGIEDFVRGTSQTAVLVEANSDLAVEWTKPQDWELDKDEPMRGLGRVRPGGFCMSFADAAVGFISLTIDPEEWYLMTQLEE
jgi:hypothetical protein